MRLVDGSAKQGLSGPWVELGLCLVLSEASIQQKHHWRKEHNVSHSQGQVTASLLFLPPHNNTSVTAVQNLQ